jgi:hypothetical protein
LFRYRLQGLLLASNRELAGLSLLDTDSSPDVVFHAGLLPADLEADKLQETEPAYTSPYCLPTGEPFSRMWRCPQSGLYYFRFVEGFVFVVDSVGSTIWAQWSDPVTIEDITAFLVGRILAFLLHLRGHACLHASAVAVNGGAVLFAGDPGMGKSSTAAAFAERGYPVLTDDVSAIRRGADGHIVMVPGVPRLCLWPDSVEFLYGPAPAERFPLLHPAEDKRVVQLDTAPGKFQIEPLPLQAIYLLAPRTADPAAPRLEAVAGADRLIRLLYTGFMNLTLEREQMAYEFPILGEIARSVPIQELVPSNDPKKLGLLCELVLNDVRAAAPPLAGRTR